MFCTLIVSACSKQAPSEDKSPAPKAPAADARTVATGPVVAAKPAKTGLARRCVLGGDPLASDCVGGSDGIVFGKDGLLYVADKRRVVRYQRAADAPPGECRLEPSGEPIELPPDNPRPQSIDGPVYMRSGGAAWNLVRGGDAIYAHDYLGGLFRIDRGKPEPSCDDVFGFKTAAQLGKRLLVARKGIEELKLGTKCKAVSAKLDDKARGGLYVVSGKLYTADGSDVVRYDGATPTKLGDGARICYVNAITACGDGACLLDSNCKQVIQLAADDTVLRVLDGDKLFATSPWSLANAATNAAGDVYLLARHRDKTNGKEICEAAIYELPAALFAR